MTWRRNSLKEASNYIFKRATLRIHCFLNLDLKRLGEGIFLKRHLISDLQSSGGNSVRAIFKVIDIV